MLPQHRGGACFCTRGAMQEYDFDLFILALAQSRGGACFCTRGTMLDYDVVLFIVALAKTVIS